MKPGSVPAVAALVLASRGGTRLARALESVEWAGDRSVLDPCGRLGGEPLPTGARRVGSAATVATSAPWLLLVQEDEVAPPALAEAVAAAVAAPDAPPAYRIGREVRGFGAALRPGGASVRLARREASHLRLRADLCPELHASGRTERLAGVFVVPGPASFTAAVEELEADSAARAALLRAWAIRPRAGRALAAALAAAGRLLLAPGAAIAEAEEEAGDRTGRWALAVFAGYRALVTYAKLWELYDAEASAVG